MKYKIVLFILLFSIIANAQKIMVFDIDSSNLPIISANYLLFDSEDKLIEDVNRSDFQIQLGTENLKIKRLIAPQRSTKVHKISIVLTVDVSGSMSGTNLELAKQAAITFIKMTPLYSCEIAITTFDDGNYINMDFTKNKDRLYNAVGKIRPMGGTDYDEGLLRGPGGALDVLDNAQYDQKIVIFLTDGLGTGSKNDIIIQAKRKDAKIYPITVNMPMPPILSDIADGTYAEYFENLTDITDAENAYIKILSTIMFTKFGQIQWLIEPVCRSRNTNMTLIYKDFKFFIPFKFSEKMLISLNSNNDLVDFGDVEVGDTAVIKVVYTAKNESFEIKEISNKHSDIFHIISPNTIPFVIPQGRSVELKVLYTPKDSVFISDKISFVTNKCNARPVLLYGGLPSKDPYDSNLDLIFPNGGEKLGIASFSKVEWEGVSVFDSIRVSLSVDSGKTYKNIGVGSNLDLSYVVPSKKSDYCLMRISHKMLSYLQYEIPLTMSAKNAQFLEDDKTVFVYGNYYVGTMNIQKGRFNSFYKSKTYMNIVCLGPEEKYFIDADRERITIRNVNDFRIQQEIKPFKLFGIRFTKLHKKYIKDVCFSSDGKYIVSIAADGEMKLWDVRKGKKIVKVKTGVRYVERIEIAPDTN
ncbi:MAG: VWA domain-containing protein, partial [Bacteroidota bacterium]|nr:VWA domain-containing protein [Bacteroidota bacterium]